ncbi:MAG: ATP-binding cassette domain-containing protein [Oscillospiraceae bacterium]|nr:ATP-binding cassette domain-containing protein [Oscillospiraceae bacterium]
MNINITGLSMTYPNGKTALDNISLRMESPTLIGLLGPNGAGKTTLMKLLTAALLPTKGSIQVNDTPLDKAERLLKSQLGYLPQSFGLYDELTVFQFLNYIAALKGIRDSKGTIDRVIAQTNLTEKRRTQIRTLSGGQRQRVGIAQALLGNPVLLIFDEPTVGLDPEERVHFRNLFSQAAQDKLVLLSTHIIEDVQSICNQILVMNHGNILFSGTPEDMIASASGHVGVFEGAPETDCEITSRINTAKGILCRCVAEKLPRNARKVEPTLEDAYLYRMQKETEKCVS